MNTEIIKYILKKKKKSVLGEVMHGEGKAEREAGPIMICIQQRLSVSRVIHAVESIKQRQGFC